MDYDEIMTVTGAIFLLLATGYWAAVQGYRRGSREAAGQIRQSFAIEIAKIRIKQREESDARK